MKKTLTVTLCVIGFMFIAAPIYMNQPNPVTLNGKPFGNAVTINGNLYISLQDFAKAAGGTLTLDPNFQLQGNTLTAKVKVQDIHFTHTVNKASPMLAQKDPSGQNPGGIILQNQLFQVRKAGEISSHVIMKDGKAFIPLADVAKAFGNASWTAPAQLAPGQSISLNFAVNGDGVLGAVQ